MISQVHLGSRAKSIVPSNNYQLDFSNYERFFLNLALSNELWVHIAAFELTLRNFIHFSLQKLLNRKDWWNFPDLLGTHEVTSVSRVEKRLKLKSINANESRIKENLTLDFWVQLLSKRYHQKIWMKLLKYFPTYPGRREDFYKRAREIRNLRNLIAHHAPILHRNLLRDHQYLHELTMILDPQLAQEVQKRSRVLDLLLNTRLVGSGGGI